MILSLRKRFLISEGIRIGFMAGSCVAVADLLIYGFSMYDAYDLPLYFGLILIPYVLVGVLLMALISPLVRTRFLRTFVISFSAYIVAFFIIASNLLLLHHVIDTDYKNRIAAEIARQSVEKGIKIRKNVVGEHPPLHNEQSLQSLRTEIVNRYELVTLIGINVVNLIPMLFFSLAVSLTIRLMTRL
ncbi:hypothetical protein [Rhodoflexus caldus]|uniref:hypothetical protein n=1 Tax=Rhodoflexus caldus TaxID=2891236 RepID=UPI002029D714|nr:hypothetical protein [Rhodoflexus caldus]